MWIPEILERHSKMKITNLFYCKFLFPKASKARELLNTIIIYHKVAMEKALSLFIE